MAVTRLLAVVSVAAHLSLLCVGAAKYIPENHRPYIIAHRGASGTLPEHTVESYHRAIHQGADFIECDVVLTKDCGLICRHEPNLQDTTDALHMFGHLQRNTSLDGQHISEGIFSTDLTLEEVKVLRAKQPRPYRDQQFNGLFKVPTLQEYIEVALAAPRTVGVVGIYVETKHPQWHDNLGLECLAGSNITHRVLQVLQRYGYGGAMGSAQWRAQPAFIQSFEVGNLRWLAGATQLPLVQLIDDLALRVADTRQPFADLITDASLDNIATYAAAIGPQKDSVLPRQPGARRQVSTADLVERAHRRGLAVHPFTFRDEPQFLAEQWDGDAMAEYQHFINQVGIDGAFTDFPGTMSRYLNQTWTGDAHCTNPKLTRSQRRSTSSSSAMEWLSQQTSRFLQRQWRWSLQLLLQA